jgi:hypothetical protein
VVKHHGGHGQGTEAVDGGEVSHEERPKPLDVTRATVSSRYSTTGQG